MREIDKISQNMLNNRYKRAAMLVVHLFSFQTTLGTRALEDLSLQKTLLEQYNRCLWDGHFCLYMARPSFNYDILEKTKDGIGLVFRKKGGFETIVISG